MFELDEDGKGEGSLALAVKLVVGCFFVGLSPVEEHSLLSEGTQTR